MQELRQQILELFVDDFFKTKPHRGSGVTLGHPLANGAKGKKKAKSKYLYETIKRNLNRRLIYKCESV